MPVLCAYGYGIFLRYHSQRSLKEDEETTAMLAPLQTTSFLRTGTQLTFKGRPRQSEREGERVGDNFREKETERKRQREAETGKNKGTRSVQVRRRSLRRVSHLRAESCSPPQGTYVRGIASPVFPVELALTHEKPGVLKTSEHEEMPFMVGTVRHV